MDWGDIKVDDRSNLIPKVQPDDKVGGNYFTRADLDHLLPPKAEAPSRPYQAVAYNFPNYHPSPAQERYFGRNWTEWQLLDRAVPLFNGHHQPKIPLWGRYNEADPLWAEREIEAASDAGIHAFMIDWYWYEGTQILHEQLEQGMLKARNRDKLKFAILWANLDWRNQYPPVEKAKDYWGCANLYQQTYTLTDMDRVVGYWLEHYLHQPNYWHVRGLPVIQLFDVDHLLKSFSQQQLRHVLDRMRERCVKDGLPGLHLQTCGYVAGKTPLKELGFDSATTYHAFDRKFGSFRIDTYATGARQSIATWQQTREKLAIPFFPGCPVGWDNSPRFGERTNVYVGRTPDQYERLLEAAKRFLDETPALDPIIFLSAWNEWSEDHYLLPDTLHGYGYLEALTRQFAPSPR